MSSELCISPEVSDEEKNWDELVLMNLSELTMHKQEPK